MAASVSQYAACRLVKDRTIELETADGRKPNYSCVLVTEDTFLVLDRDTCDLQLFSLRDGKLLAKLYKLVHYHTGVCLISKTQVAVCLVDSRILILSLKSADDGKWVKTIDVMTGLESYECHSVAKLNSTDKLVVSGVKWNDSMLYWCVVNLTDGSIESSHKVCERGFGLSYLAVKDNTVCISCWISESTTTTGVYAYDIFNPHTRKFLYQHLGFTPDWIMVDKRNFIYVCDSNSTNIHQLTDSGQLVTILTVSSRPIRIFYDDQHGIMYTTSLGSNVITVYRLEYE